MTVAPQLKLAVDGLAATVDDLAYLALGGYGHCTAMQVRGGRTPGLDSAWPDSTPSSVRSGSTSVNNQGTYPVQPGQYGWITLSKVARKVTGTWTFSAGDLPWKADDTVALPVAHDPGGLSTVYSINSGDKPPVCKS
ncbi:hypothetical protein OG689_35345 [Kitasatospora sp. NBC_00240]|uniref:hypothetical protein n=1 Tax=Kitasatospora sp. NBC_00240 TaxID=2903567 RepID=UPI00224CF2D7|nr:hypothetical protein [Kitasatospora sp. NBC_00240]MCX5214475.1 hypothetical protein [Kitasatospora sp. NBC_00240]